MSSYYTWKSMPVCSHWTVISQVSHARVAETTPPQWIHTQSKEAKGHCTGYHTDRQKLSLAHGPSQSKKVRLIAQPTWSSWYVTVMPMFTMVQIVVFLTAPYSKTTRESWKILAGYLPPVSLVANPSQSPSLARPSQLGFRTLAVNTLGE